MKLDSFFLVPHPPILLPEVGGKESGRISDTRSGMDAIADRIAVAAPKTVIIISPHGPVFSDAVGVLFAETLSGDLGGFNAPGIKQEYAVDRELAQDIVETMNEAGVPSALVSPGKSGRGGGLDHGVLVPLNFLWSRGLRPMIVEMGASYLSFEELYHAGMCIRKAVEGMDDEGNVVLMASGDLSHRLTPDAPAGYDPGAKGFDEWLVRNLREFDPMELTNPDRTLLEKAGECGYRPLVMMLGAMDGRIIAPEILSYEGPFGVGYAVGAFGDSGPGESIHGELLARRNRIVSDRRGKESPMVSLARSAVESWVREGRRLEPKPGEPEGFTGKAAVFVSIKKHGELRGCIGTTSPTTDSIAEEVVQNAISACSEDPRFESVEESELEHLVYSVDVLTEAEPIEGMSQLDPRVYGVIVSSGGRRGLLLPDLEGIDTAEEQVEIARRKAGIPQGAPLRLERFGVVRYK